jgi:hypothetical protein
MGKILLYAQEIQKAEARELAGWSQGIRAAFHANQNEFKKYMDALAGVEAKPATVNDIKNLMRSQKKNGKQNDRRTADKAGD